MGFSLDSQERKWATSVHRPDAEKVLKCISRLCILLFSPVFGDFTTMTKTSKKSTRKFAANGSLQRTITNRRKFQQVRQKIEKKSAAKQQKAKGKERINNDEDADSVLNDGGGDKVDSGSRK